MWIKRFQLFKMFDVFEKQLGLMRKRAGRKGAAIHWLLDELHNKTSHAFYAKDAAGSSGIRPA